MPCGPKRVFPIHRNTPASVKRLTGCVRGKLRFIPNLSMCTFLSHGFFFSKHSLCLCPLWLVDAFWCIMDVTQVWWESAFCAYSTGLITQEVTLAAGNFFGWCVSWATVLKWPGRHVSMWVFGWNTRKADRRRKSVDADPLASFNHLHYSLILICTLFKLRSANVSLFKATRQWSRWITKPFLCRCPVGVLHNWPTTFRSLVKLQLEQVISHPALNAVLNVSNVSRQLFPAPCLIWTDYTQLCVGVSESAPPASHRCC